MVHFNIGEHKLYFTENYNLCDDQVFTWCVRCKVYPR